VITDYVVFAYVMDVLLPRIIEAYSSVLIDAMMKESNYSKLKFYD
jgi:hypothetical protein